MRAIIIERWAILRHGVRAVLNQAGHPVLSAAITAAEGLDAVRAGQRVELVIAGQTDDQDLVALVTQLRGAAPEAKVLVLADRPDLEEIDAILAAGAAGILGRLAEGIELLDAIDRIGREERVLSNEVIGTLLGGIDPSRGAALAPEATTGTPLTARETEILSCLVTGASNREIARALFIGESTVKTHLASTYAKLGVTSRHQAVARGLELGIVAWRGPSTAAHAN